MLASCFPLRPFVALAAGVLLCTPAYAQPAPADAAFPTKPIRLIVPFAPAGPNDFLARIVGQKLTEAWGQTVVIDNRGGAGGTIGTELGIRAPADGYTLLMGGASTLTVAPALYPKLGYDPLRDITPIGNIARVPYLLGVHPSVPARNVQELIALARAKPGTVTYGSSGTGSMSSLAAEMLRTMAKVDITHVPYKGTAPAITDVIAGNITLMLADLAVILPHAKTGKLRAIAVTGPGRSASAPDIPTIEESGLPGYSLSVWFGLIGPRGLPDPVVRKTASTLSRALRSPDVAERLVRQGYDPLPDTPDAFAAFIRAETKRMGTFIREANIRPQ